MAEDEGMDFEGQFFHGYGKDKARTAARIKAERKAGQTAKQRANRKAPKKQINIRITAETRAILGALVEHLELSQTDVLELAIAELGKAKLGAGK